MKIAIISTYDNAGGAPLAAFRLHKGLRLLNHQSTMVVRFKNSDDPDIYTVYGKNWQMNMETEVFKTMEKLAIHQNRTELSNTSFSMPYPGFNLTKTDFIQSADVINLHWVSYFQSVETIAALLKLGKPVVWTLHDQNAFTGGCHYAAECPKYREDCRDCPQLNDNTAQIPFSILNNKALHWQDNLTIVTPSHWLTECARQSRLFKNFRVETIPNSLETDIFTPTEKKAAKQALGIHPLQLTLLIGAHSSNEKRKGFSQLVEAIHYCLLDQKFKDLANQGGIKILTFGPPQEELTHLEIEIKSFGFIGDTKKLAAIYSAADLFILPSLEDNLPNTMLESMACGTPVISFAVGGMPDLIKEGITGSMAPCFDSQKLGQAILNLLFDDNKRKQMNRNCRHMIETNFKLQDQANHYLQLFNELLKGKSIGEKNERHKPARHEIILDEWEPVCPAGIFDLYRKSALTLLIEGMGQKQKLHEQLNQMKTGNNRFVAVIGRLGDRFLEKTKKLLKPKRK